MYYNCCTKESSSDGNGRVGRIIMRVLKEYENDKMFLIDTIKHEQDLYEKTCEELLNFEIEENN